MRTAKDISIGQQVFLKPIGNAARRNNTELIECTITKIGKKYFTADEWYGRFFIDTLIHDNGDYSPNYKCYLDKQEILDEKEHASLLKEVELLYQRQSLETLREIKKLLVK